jgi:hypothetical protein
MCDSGSDQSGTVYIFLIVIARSPVAAAEVLISPAALAILIAAITISPRASATSLVAA